MQFSVDVEKRAGPPDLERMDVVHAFAKAVNQPPNKVDLNNPTKTILANVIKGNCSVAVVKDYRYLSKMNLRAVAAADTQNDDEKQQSASQ